MSESTRLQGWSPTHEVRLEREGRVWLLVPPPGDELQTKPPCVRMRGWTAAAWLHPDRLPDFHASALGCYLRGQMVLPEDVVPLRGGGGVDLVAAVDSWQENELAKGGAR